MSAAPDQGLLEALLDSWDRNNIILVSLLRAVPADRLGTRAMEGSPSIAELFGHIHYVRLVFVLEDTPEFARDMPKQEWAAERDGNRMRSYSMKRQSCARCGKEQAGGGPGDGSSLRSSNSSAPAHDLA